MMWLSTTDGSPHCSCREKLPPIKSQLLLLLSCCPGHGCSLPMISNPQFFICRDMRGHMRIEWDDSKGLAQCQPCAESSHSQMGSYHSFSKYLISTSYMLRTVFFFFWDQGLNSGLCNCKAGTPLLLSHTSSSPVHFAQVILDIGFCKLFSQAGLEPGSSRSVSVSQVGRVIGGSHRHPAPATVLDIEDPEANEPVLMELYSIVGR
jgi:hypothetical protein